MLYRLLLISVLFITLFTSWSSHATQGYTVYSDPDGVIYLMAPKQFVLIRKSTSIPLNVRPKNGLLKVYESDGVWHMEALSESEWGELKLTEGNSQVRDIQFADLDGDQMIDAFLVLNNQRTPYLKLENLTGEASLFSAVGYSMVDALRNYMLVDQDGDGIVDVVPDDYGFEPVRRSFAVQQQGFQTAQSLSAGMTQSEFRVDEMGAATYQIPLSLPSGIAGVQPRLSFSYNSSGADGHLGAGWSFSGASMISRCAKNLETDNFQGNISFSSADRLCLDGQRLVSSTGISDVDVSDSQYWSASQYHTEIESFSLIKQHGSTMQGPKAITVETKTGEIHYYGDVTYVTGNDSRDKSLAISLQNTDGDDETAMDALLEVDGATTPRLWALKAIRDVKGNYIAFRYYKDNLTGSHYLSEVYYTGREDQAPFAKVVLNYKENFKIKSGFLAGQKVLLDKLLQSVSIYQDNQPYRYYQLQYLESHVMEEKNYLTAVQECTDSSVALCFNPLTFDWNKPPVNPSAVQEVCSGCWYEATTDNYAPFSTSFTKKGTSVDRSSQLFFDIFGSGTTDMIYADTTSWKLRGSPNYSSDTNLTTVGLAQKKYAQSIDFNGDGVRDLLVANNSSSNWFAVYYKQGAVAACDPVVAGTGCPSASTTRTLLTQNLGVQAIGLEGFSQVVDFDGDGLEDILFIDNYKFKVYRNLGTVNGTHQGFSVAIDVGDASNVLPETNEANLANLRGAVSFDMNGDGRTDVLMKVLGGYCSNPDIDTRKECESNHFLWTDLTRWVLFSSNGTRYELIQELGNFINPRAVDLNGDGYTDFMYQSGTTWYYRLSNGVQFLSPKVSTLSTPSARVNQMLFADLNQDGRTDVLLPVSNSSWSLILSRAIADHQQIVFEDRGTFNFDADAVIKLGDVDADGKIDVLTATDDTGWKIYKNARPDSYDHTVSKFTNSWGAATNVTYQRLTQSNGMYWRKGSSNNINSDFAAPYAGIYTVSSVNTAGAGSVNYSYGGLLVNKRGRGFLGFEHLRTYHVQTLVSTETRYSQTWPYIGMPLSTVQYRNAKLISSATNTLQQQTSAFGGIFPYISGSTERSYGLSGTQLTISTPLSVVTNQFSYDTYGNLITSEVIQQDPTTTDNRLVTTTTNTFGDNATYERFGRLTGTTTEKVLYSANEPVSTISRSSAFSYNLDYLLETEVFSSDVEASKSTTTYGYDAAGNKTSTIITAGTDANGSVLASRASSATYTSDYRFIATTTDVSGQTSQYHYNNLDAESFSLSPQLLQTITIIDPNNQSNTTSVDGFGSTIGSSIRGADLSDVAVNTTVTKSFCASCDSSFNNAYIKVVTATDAGAEQQLFYDMYGNDVGSKTKLPLNTGYSVVRNVYDTYGNLTLSYEPKVNSVSIYRTNYVYDQIFRVTQARLINNGLTVSTATTTYNGLSTTQTDRSGKNKTSLTNYLGQEVQTTDHTGSTLAFKYNAYGQLLSVTSDGVLQVANEYDSYGRKLSMADIDKGTWSYVTNGFGELISQTDAKLQTTNFEYNSIGQPQRRFDPAGTVCWYFGTDQNLYNVNQLIDVKQWVSNEQCDSSVTPFYSERYSYNSKALLSSKTISTGGSDFVTSTTYNALGQPFELTLPSVGSISGPVLRTEYSNGVAYKTTDYSSGDPGTVYQLTTSVNARGQATGVTYGNGATASFTYDDMTGWLKGNTVLKGTTTVQSYSYVLDVSGNVTTRNISFGVGSNANLSETFGYDDLHRVTSRAVNTALGLDGALAMSESYSYDSRGNFIQKATTGFYEYGDEAKPNRLSAVWQESDFSGTQYYNFSYDANGNVIEDGVRSFSYTSFDKPDKVTQGDDFTDFEYGPNRGLIKRIDKRGNDITTTLMLDGYEQVTLPSGVVEHKYYVGDAVITKRSNASNETYYLHNDQQGSTTAITDSNGNTVQQYLYDPWGKQYVVNTSLLTYTSPSQSKGYTGHEMVNDFEVIHMGGRTYNPTLGRFMQADPFIQAPGNLQNYNRYSYVMNNPMSYTDPSGYFFKKIGSFLKKFWKPLLAIAATVVTYGAASGWAASWGMTQSFLMPVLGTTQTFVTGLSTVGSITAGAISGAVGGFVGGALATGSLTGALRGAASGMIAGAAGGYANFGSVSGWGDAAKRVAVSAAGGCAAGEAAGGSCSKGARTAAMVQALTMGASETYKKVSAKYNKTGEPHLWQEGQSDVGKQLDPLDAKKYADGILKPKDVPLAYDKSTFMQTMGKGPFMDAFAEFHDGLHSAPFNWPDGQFALIATMPPSYALTVVAAMKPYSYYYYVGLLDGRRR